MSSTAYPAFSMQRYTFLAADTSPVMMWTLASSRTPDMPMGSATPSWPSTMNSWGSTCRISRSAGMATCLVSSSSRWTSSRSISPPVTVMTPLLWNDWMWSPAMPTTTDRVLMPAARSASPIALRTASTVLSMLTTTPRLSPSDDATPTPRTWMRPTASALATTAQILVVPMSTPTTTRSPEEWTWSRMVGFGWWGEWVGVATGGRGGRVLRRGQAPPVSGLVAALARRRRFAVPARKTVPLTSEGDSLTAR